MPVRMWGKIKPCHCWGGNVPVRSLWKSVIGSSTKWKQNHHTHHPWAYTPKALCPTTRRTGNRVDGGSLYSGTKLRYLSASGQIRCGTKRHRHKRKLRLWNLQKKWRSFKDATFNEACNGNPEEKKPTHCFLSCAEVILKCYMCRCGYRSSNQKGVTGDGRKSWGGGQGSTQCCGRGSEADGGRGEDMGEWAEEEDEEEEKDPQNEF